MSNSEVSPTSHLIRVFLVDDHPIFREGLARLINDEEDMRVCGESEKLGKTLQLLKKNNPSVLVTDIAFREMDLGGLELIKQVQINHPKLPILVLSSREEPLYAERAFRAGVQGYLHKNNNSGEILEAIRVVESGDYYVSDNMQSRIFNFFLKGRGKKVSSSVELLSDRELEVFHLLGEGKSRQEIADKLFLSPKTIGSHIRSIREKLDLESTQQLLRFAIEWLRGEREE